MYSHESMVVRHFAHVPQLHRWARLLDALRGVFDRSAVPKDGINPFIFKAIRQLAKHRENVAETVRQGGVNVVLHGSSISQVQNVDIVTNLADPLHSAFALPTAFSTAPLATIAGALQKSRIASVPNGVDDVDKIGDGTAGAQNCVCLRIDCAPL